MSKWNKHVPAHKENKFNMQAKRPPPVFELNSKIKRPEPNRSPFRDAFKKAG